MMFQRSIASALGVLSIALMLVGCQTMTGRTAGRYIDDQTITAGVKSKLVADRLANLTRVNVTTQNGVVYLTGNVDSSDRAQRATELARNVKGVRDVVNEIQVASATPPSVVSTAPPSGSSTVVTTAPPATTAAPAPTAPPATTAAPAPTAPPAPTARPTTSAAPATSAAMPASPPTSNVAASQRPVDVSGTVAQYDTQTGIITFQDGRIVKIPPAGAVWRAQRASDMQPGQQVYVRDAMPIGLQSSATQGAATQGSVATPGAAGAQTAAGSWHFGTVSRVEPAANTLYLTDGTAVQIQPSTRLTLNGQPIALSQVQPGAEVAVLRPASAASSTTPSSATGSAYALPRSTAGTSSSSQVVIFNGPQSR
jgi:BON domain